MRDDMESCVKYDDFDRMAYENIFNESKDLQEITEQGKHVLKTFGELASDVFNSLYKVRPELVLQNDLAPEYILNHEMMSKLMESQSYQQLRQYTQLDELGAGLGSKALLETLLKQLQQDSSLKEASNKINQSVAKRKAADPMDKNTVEFEQAMVEESVVSDNVRQLIKNMQSKLRQAVELATERATEEVEDVENIVKSWGLQQGEFVNLPYAKKLEILSVLRGQQKFKDMANLVGRMKSLAKGSRKSKLEQRVELHSITQGSDINHVLPQELLALRRPTLKLDFYRKMMEKQLLQYDLNHQECIGQGPIIVLIDTSGSMRSGTKEIWSKAVALGLAEIAEKERRAFSYALFASKHDDLVTDDFLQIGQRSPDKLIRLASEFIGGGTDFEKPLLWAMVKLEESKFSKADIVMITDGACEVSTEFLKELQKAKDDKKFRIYSILIGSNSQELSHWSDEVWEINDLLDDSVAKELFLKI